MLDERLSVAPMMEMTDSHWRMMIRGLTRKTVLYTEMVVDDTIIHSPDLDFFIGKGIDESPSVIQLGGSDPTNLARAAELCEQYGGGYGEINLNCGCPSERVSKRCFGAQLMLKPDLVREIVQSMQRRVSIPVTVKCRIGADNRDSYGELKDFIASAHEGGARKFIIHSRKCFLKGLSTKQNRDIPPLKYGVVHRLRQEFPELTFILNGGITTFDSAAEHMTESGFLYRPHPETEQKPKSGCLDLTWDHTTPSLKRLLSSIGSGSSSIGSGGPAHKLQSVFSASIQTAFETTVAAREAAGLVTTIQQESARSETESELDMAQELLRTPLSAIADDFNTTGTEPAAVGGGGGGAVSAVDAFLLPAVHGVMIGRAAFNNPFLFATADSRFYGVADPCLTRREVAQRYITYCEWAQSDDAPKKKIGGRKGQPVTTSVLMRPMHNLMIGMKTCGKYKQALNDLYMEGIKGINGTPNPSPRVILEGAMAQIEDEYLDAPLGNNSIGTCSSI